jgi:HemY protein|tara:strand:- start:4215 stop:5426 length:1212 start_codon:yes stop_codon:yes gene_type:complete
VRRLLVTLVMALLLGAASIWVMQSDSGYILLSFNNTTVEMTVWVGILLYLTVTGLGAWLLLLFKWLGDVGGLRRWWTLRRSQQHGSKTAQGLILFADHDWKQASTMLLSGADGSSMPDVNLLFAARAAAENNQIDQARMLLEQLKVSHPKAKLLADKTLAEMLILEEQLDEAIQLLQPIAASKPGDRGVLRLLSDTYYLMGDWSSLQKLLHDLNYYKAINPSDMKALEQDVYANLLSDFIPNPEFTLQEQKDQAGDLWELIPRRLHNDAELICGYFDALQQVNDTDRVQLLLVKTINKRWHPELVERFGQLETSAPEKQLLAAEKWLSDHPEDAVLLVALGRICCQLRFWGKARDYFSVALRLQPSADIYLRLADVHAAMGDQIESHNMYKQGLRVSLGVEDK